MVGDTKTFFVTTHRPPENAILGKKYFRAGYCATHKSPLRNLFLFVYHKLGWDME